MHGNIIFPLIKCMHPDMAGKITGMLLDNNSIAQLISMFEDQDKLKAAVMVAIPLSSRYRNHGLTTKLNSVQLMG